MKPLYESIKNINTILNRTREQFVISSRPVKNITYKLCDYKTGSELPTTEDFIPFTKDTTWGYERDQHAWFHSTVDVPELEGREFKLEISTQIGP